MNESLPHSGRLTHGNSSHEQVHFLGFCDKFRIDSFGPDFFTHSLLNLRQWLVSPLYPLPSQGLWLVLGILDINSFVSAELRIVSLDGTVTNTLTLAANDEVHSSGASVKTGSSSAGVPTISHHLSNLTLFGADLSDTNIVIMSPGLYTLQSRIKDHSEWSTIGQFRCGTYEVGPLTPELIESIEKHPSNLKTFELSVKCNQCNAIIRMYASTCRKQDKEDEGFIWYRALPDSFQCSCGKTNWDLSGYRKNMHAMLGTPLRAHKEAPNLHQLYQETKISSVIANFVNLLNSNPEEEQVKQFIKAHPILLQPFSPRRIICEPQILAKHRADFAIENALGHLVLLELEKPSTPLLTKAGRQTHSVTHAFKQVGDWLYECHREWSAVLRCLNLSPEHIMMPKGVVIMGRNADHDREHLQKLKRSEQNNVTFMTYDDLIVSLTGMHAEILAL